MKRSIIDSNTLYLKKQTNKKQNVVTQWLDIDTQNTLFLPNSNWIKYNINQNKIFCSKYFGRPKLKNSELYLCCFKNVSKCPESWKYYWNMVCWQGFIIPTHVIEQNQISICRKKLYSYYRLNEDQITRTMNCCRWYIQNL